jgi:hypothetical protein
MRQSHTILFLLAALAMTACVAKSGRSNNSAEPPKPSAFSRHILVHDRALDLSTGEFVADFEFPVYWPTAMPAPGRPGWYELEAGWGRSHEVHAGRLINPTTGESEEVPLDVLRTFDESTREVIRLNDDGTERWRFAEPGERWYRPPNVQIKNYRPKTCARHGHMLLFGFADSQVAVDDVTGKLLARIPFRCHETLLTDDYLVGVVSKQETGEWFVEGRAVSGPSKAAFTLSLWKQNQSGVDLSRCGENFIARSGRTFWDPGLTKLFDSKVKVIIEASERLDPLIECEAGGWIASGQANVSKWDASGQLSWSSPYDDVWGWLLRRELLELPGGNIIVAEYDPISASSVVVSCLDEQTGFRNWTATCAVYGEIAHSKYRHEVYLELIDGKLVVCCQQSACVFAEVLDPSNGRQIHRWELTDKLADADWWN